jgi:hypothetical protein
VRGIEPFLRKSRLKAYCKVHVSLIAVREKSKEEAYASAGSLSVRVTHGDLKCQCTVESSKSWLKTCTAKLVEGLALVLWVSCSLWERVLR